MNRRWTRALRAGGTTLLLGLLCAAALALPALSTQNFAHTHSGSTPHHVHPLHLLLGSTPAAAPTVAVDVTQLEDVLPFYVTSFVAAEVFTGSRSRAPPPNVEP